MAFTLKIQLRDDLRRVAFDSRPSFTELRGTISRLFVSRNIHPQFCIKYIDEEGDQVTIESDFELNFALPASHRGTTTRLVITEPPASAVPRSQPQAPPVRPAPTPFDFSPFQEMLRSFGGISACPVQSQQGQQDFNPAPFINMVMRGFAQGNQPATFDISSIFNLLSGLNASFQPTPPTPAQPEKTPEAPKTPSSFSCPFDFFQGLVESTLEENEEWKGVAEKYVRRFIKEHAKAAGNVLPKLEELINLAVETITAIITDQEVHAQCPWIKLFAPEQVRGLLDSILASPVVQEIVFTAYSAVSEAVEKKQQRSAAPPSAPTFPIPVPVPRVPEPVVAPVVVPPPVVPEDTETETEKGLLIQLASMGFSDRRYNLRMLRRAGCDLEETIHLLLQ